MNVGMLIINSSHFLVFNAHTQKRGQLSVTLQLFEVVGNLTSLTVTVTAHVVF